MGVKTEELTTKVDSLKDKLSKYKAVEEDLGSKHNDNENIIEISSICNQEEFRKVYEPEIAKQPVITKKRNGH